MIHDCGELVTAITPAPFIFFLNNCLLFCVEVIIYIENNFTNNTEIWQNRQMRDGYQW